MLKIRLQRVGRKKQPYFRFVLTESTNSTKSGKFNEVLGFFDFRENGKHSIDAEKVKYWISKGAQISDTVHNYLVAEKIIEGKKRNVLPRKSPIKKDEQQATDNKQPVADVPKETTPVAEETPKEEVKV